MTRSELESVVRRYLQFSSLETQDFDAALDRTRQENAALRVPEQARSQQVTPDAGRFALPSDFRAMRRLVGPYGELLAAPFTITDQTRRKYAGPPTLYNLEADFVAINSRDVSELEFLYWGIEDRLGSAADATTPMLTAYPGLFIHRCTGEIALITQDADIASVHLQQYDRLFQRIQTQARLAQGGRGIVSTGG